MLHDMLGCLTCLASLCSFLLVLFYVFLGLKEVHAYEFVLLLGMLLLGFCQLSFGSYVCVFVSIHTSSFVSL